MSPYNGNISTSYSYVTADKSWQVPAVLRSLYLKQGLSLREVGETLGCDRCTVRRWLLRFDIDTRPANDQKTQPCYSVNSAGYRYFSSEHNGDRARVAIHELVAIAGGADPHRVFSDETECHHRLRIPSSLNVGIHLDIPNNIEVLNAREHRQVHAENEYEQPHEDEVLDRADTPE